MRQNNAPRPAAGAGVGAVLLVRRRGCNRLFELRHAAVPAQQSQYATPPIRYGHPPRTVARPARIDPAASWRDSPSGGRTHPSHRLRLAPRLAVAEHRPAPHQHLAGDRDDGLLLARRAIAAEPQVGLAGPAVVP